MENETLTPSILNHRTYGGLQTSSRKFTLPQNNNNSSQRSNGATNNLVYTSSMSRKSPQRATVTKKTRTYMVDGIEGTPKKFIVLSFINYKF